MMDKILRDLYGRWTESDSYKTESALEDGRYNECKKEIVKIIGKKRCSQISDSILGLAFESEVAGFEKGFCYGVTFMMECANPVALRKSGAING